MLGCCIVAITFAQHRQRVAPGRGTLGQFGVVTSGGLDGLSSLVPFRPLLSHETTFYNSPHKVERFCTLSVSEEAGQTSTS